MPQDNCDTGRTIFANKRLAEAMIPGAGAKRCDRCKGFHNKADRPKTRASRRAKKNSRTSDLS